MALRDVQERQLEFVRLIMYSTGKKWPRLADIQTSHTTQTKSMEVFALYTLSWYVSFKEPVPAQPEVCSEND